MKRNQQKIQAFCRNNDLEKLESLLLTDNKNVGWSKALHTARKNKNSKAFGLIISVYKSIIVPVPGIPMGYTLELARSFGDVDIIKMIFNNFEISESEYNELLRETCWNGQISIAKFLLEMKDKFNAWLHPPFICSCNAGHLPIVKMILEKGRGDPSFEQGLTNSVQNRHFLVARLMIEKGARSQTPLIKEILDIGLSMSFIKHYSMYRLLLQNNSDRKQTILPELSFYLIDDLVSIVLWYSLWVEN